MSEVTGGTCLKLPQVTLLLLQPGDVEQSVGHEDENNSSLEATVDVGLVGADQSHLSTTVEAGQPGLS